MHIGAECRYGCKCNVQRLGKDLGKKLLGRFASKKCNVHIRAHSMGGLVFAATLLTKKYDEAVHKLVRSAIFYDCPFNGVDYEGVIKASVRAVLHTRKTPATWKHTALDVLVGGGIGVGAFMGCSFMADAVRAWPLLRVLGNPEDLFFLRYVRARLAIEPVIGPEPPPHRLAPHQRDRCATCFHTSSTCMQSPPLTSASRTTRAGTV